MFFRKIQQQKGAQHEKVLSLVDFKVEVAEALCKMGTVQRCGRPSSELNKQIELKRKKSTASPLPPKEVRIDCISHWPIRMSTRLSCKRPGCNILSFTKCEKCNVALCYGAERNCFIAFHK